MKILHVEEFNALFGFDVLPPTRDRERSRIRQGVWVSYYCNGYTQGEIAEIFGCSRQNIAKGIESFEVARKNREYTAMMCSQKLMPYWV